MCIEQMTYAGVFEAVKIRKSGYPFRYSHAQFTNIYRWGQRLDVRRSERASNDRDRQIGRTL